MMAIFLVGLVVMILLRTLRKDFARYRKDDEFNVRNAYKDFAFIFLIRCI